MFNRVSEWLDAVLKTDIPHDVAAFGFNLYEDGHFDWSMELIGASEFDIANEDWLCSEVTDFNTRNNPLQWHKEANWEEILNDTVCALKEYLNNGKYADILKAKSGVGIGFVEGSIEILYAKNEGKMLKLIEQKISEWQEDDIYAISLYVFNVDDDPCRPAAVLGYNTEKQVQKSIPEASDEQEARWNYAFWLQNEEICIGMGETAGDIRQWITEQDLWEDEDEIPPKFVEMLVFIVREIHASGLLKDKYGREVPILIHGLEYNEETARQNMDANGEILDSGFVSFCIPCEQEIQDGFPIPDSYNGSVIINKKKTTDIRLITVFIVIMAFIILTLFLCLGLMLNSHKEDVPTELTQLTEDFEEKTFVSSKQEETESGQIKRRAYIQPGMPEPFIKVLRQYEQFMNADEQDLNDEDVRKKIDSADGEWQYLYDELCGMWMSAVWIREEEDVIRYSLTDLTGDGYPELIMGYYLSDDTISPQVVYYYSQAEGIKMECLSSYYTMVLYEGGIIKYISGGAAYTETYVRFQEKTESWEMTARVVVDWDFTTDSVRGYYWGDDVGGDLTNNRPMSEEEYQKIIDQYAAEPLQLEWVPLLAETSSSEEREVLAQGNSFPLVYDGVDTGVEIAFEDCVCEYDKNGTKVYSYYVDDFDIEGYVLYVENIEHTSTLFPVKDYQIDQEDANLYTLWGIESFGSIQGIDFIENPYGYMIQTVSSMENMISEAYGLEFMDDGMDFEDLQVEFTGIKEDKKRFLCGKAAAVYKRTGKQYTIEWEIDTDTCAESAKGYLADMDLDPLYAAFLKNEICVKNPFAVEGAADFNTELTFWDDKEYDSGFEIAQKYFSLVDVNNDDKPELIFKMVDSPSELLYLLGVQNEKLVCYDLHETHTTHMGFHIYDNGVVCRGQNYDGSEEEYYTFGSDGSCQSFYHFIKEEGSETELYYDYYYKDGKEDVKYSLLSNGEYEKIIANIAGEEPVWYECDAFKDIPQ